MSRLGDMIHKERTQRGLSAKQVAKMGGVSEKYVLEVEAGSRIIADDAARRLLKAMGKTGELVSDFEAMASGDPTPRPVAPAPPPPAVQAQAEAPSGQINTAWLSAMGGVLHPVPVKDAKGATLSSRPVPTENGKIEGAPPEKVFYLVCPDTTMRGYRLRPGDLLLVVPAAAPADNATMVLKEDGLMAVRRVTRQEGGRVLLQWFEAEPQSRVAMEKELQWIGRAVRCEFAL